MRELCTAGLVVEVCWWAQLFLELLAEYNTLQSVPQLLADYKTYSSSLNHSRMFSLTSSGDNMDMETLSLSRLRPMGERGPDTYN